MSPPPAASLAARFAQLCTPAELARIALPRAPDELVDDARRRAIAHLPIDPGPFFSFGCFECRLGADPRVDFLACVLDRDGAREAIESQKGLVSGASGGLLEAWSKRSAASLDTGGLWFEWDAGPGPSWRPFAFVRAAERVPAGRWTAPRLAAWIDWAGPRLTPGGLSGEWRRAVLQANDALPPSCKIQHLAATSARADCQAIRLHVGLHRRDLAEGLRGLGFSHGAVAVAEVLDAWSALPDPVGVQFDVGDGPPRWIDLEFYLNTTPSDDPRWACFSRWAESLDAVRREKLAAALDWGEPCSLPDPTQLLLRRTSFKARIHADGAIAVKAYLGFSPRSIPGSGTKTRDQVDASTTPQPPSLAVAAARSSALAAPSHSHASASASSRQAR